VIKVITVNVLTSLRVVLSLLFVYFIIFYSSNVFIIVIVFAVTCVTDFFDGRLARKLMVSTKFGAIFDVTADLFFIMISYSVLIMKNIIPAWILVVVLLKFSEFCVTSSIAKKTGKCQDYVFFFDILGSAVVLLFYALPIVAILLRHYLLPEMLYPIVNVICCIITIMACISSFYRIKKCLAPVHFHRNYGIVDKQSSLI